MDEIIKRRSEITVLLNEMRDKPEKFDQDEFDKLMAEDAKLEARQEAFQALEKRNVQINASVNTPINHDLELSDNSPIIAGEDRATTKPFRHLGEFMLSVRNAGMKSGEIDPRLKPLEDVEGFRAALPHTANQVPFDNARAALSPTANTQIPSEGGFLMGKEDGGFMDTVVQNSTILSSCRKTSLPPGITSFEFKRVDETSRATGSRGGGVRMYHGDELKDAVQSSSAIRAYEWKPQKIVGLWPASDELVANARSYVDVVSALFADELDFILTDDVLRGTGVGMSLGILNSDALVETAIETDQAAGEFLFENIVHMRGRIDVRVRASAQSQLRWYLNSELEEKLALMGMILGTAAAPVYLPEGGASVKPYETLLGYPTSIEETSTALNSVGDILLADLNQYLLVDKGNVEQRSSIHVKFIEGQELFKWTYYVFGAPLWATSITPYQTTGSKKVSFATVLGARS